MSEAINPRSIFLDLDRFQKMKLRRMRILLREIETRGEVDVNQFLGSIASNHGIRRNTGEEYLRDWIDAGNITVQKNIIHFVKKQEEANSS